MKKRIISLILVVATVFLLLTSCTFNYAKKDMGKYADFNSAAFLAAIQKLEIEMGDFGVDENERLVKVAEAIAKNMLNTLDKTQDRVYSGTVNKYDALYYNYYAVDGKGNVFYADKMLSANVSNLQLGLEANKDLVAAIEEALKDKDIANYIYNTDADRIGEKDVIVISFTETIKEPKTDDYGFVYKQKVDAEGNPVVDENGTPVYEQELDSEGNPVVDKDNNPVYVIEYNEATSPKVDKQLVVVSDGTGLNSQLLKNFYKDILGLVSGDSIDTLVKNVSKTYTFKVKGDDGNPVKDDDGKDKTVSKTLDSVYTYTGIEIGDLIYDFSADTANKSNLPKLTASNGDIVFVSYTMEFAWNEADGTPVLGTLNTKDDKYTATIKNRLVKVDATSKDAFIKGVAEGSAFTDNIKQVITYTTKDGATETNEVDAKITGVTVDQIVNTGIDNDLKGGIEVSYKPYPKDEDDADKKNTLKNIYGKSIDVTDATLTYYVFPTYKLDVSGKYDTEDEYVKVILSDFYQTLLASKPHDHTAEEHDEEFAIEILNDKEFKTEDGKILADLIYNIDDPEAESLYTLCADTGTITKGDDGKYTYKGDLGRDQLKKDYTEKVTALQTAQKAYAQLKSGSKADDVTKAQKDIDTAKANLELATEKYLGKTGEDGEHIDGIVDKVDAQIELILSCKKGEETVTKHLIEDYEDYQYDTLEQEFESDAETKLSEEIVKLAKEYIAYKKLPKQAVNAVKDSIIDSYKYDYYSKEYNSTTGGYDINVNYVRYETSGGFEQFLIDKVSPSADNKYTIDEVYAKIESDAEESVKKLVLVYSIVDALGKDVKLTSSETKEIKKMYKEYTALLNQYTQGAGLNSIQTFYHSYLFYSMYGETYYTSVDDAIHAAQVDKLFEYLFEEAEKQDGVETNDPYYKHITYTWKAEDNK